MRLTKKEIFKKAKTVKVETKRTAEKYLLFGALTISTVCVVFPIIIKKNLPPVVPLFYGLPEGGEQLADSILLVVPGVVSLIITIVNKTIGNLINDKFLSYTLNSFSLAISILCAITVFKIAFLVGSF